MIACDTGSQSNRRNWPLTAKRTTRTSKSKVAAKTVTKRKSPTKKTVPAKAKSPARTKQTASAASRKLLELVIKSLDADQAEDIQSIDISNKSPMADFMVVASGRSNRHVAAIAEHLSEELKKAGMRCRAEGLQQGDWVLIDAMDVIIHVFRPEIRTFYSLEKMWGGSEPLTEAV